MNPLVTPQQVAARLRDPHTVLLDATLPPVGVTPRPDMRARYLEHHIPGAVFFDIDALSDQHTALPHMLPTPERFAHDMGQLGLRNTDTLIVYEQGDVFSAPRAWWMLRTFGVRDVLVLDGGLQGWIEAGLPTESGPVHRPLTTFHANLNATAVRSFDQMQTLIHNRAQILDARSAGRFHGTSPEPRPGIRAGHMPGATSLPYTELIDGPRLKPATALKQVFTTHNINLAAPITTTCGSGVTASVLALALELTEASEVSLYDGSWAEYAQHPQAAIETTTTMKEKIQPAR